MARDEGKHDLGSAPEDGFPDGAAAAAGPAELLGNAHSSRSDPGRTREGGGANNTDARRVSLSVTLPP